jgi:hypothetical protein
MRPDARRGREQGSPAASRERSRRARRGLRLNALPTAVHADRRQRLHETWQRALAEEALAAWPR